MLKLEAPTWKILVRLEKVNEEKEKKSEGGLILQIKTEKDLEIEREGNCLAYIEEVGPVAGKYTYWPDQPRQEYRKGQCVLIHRYAGSLIRPDIVGDKENVYRLINDVDIQLCVRHKDLES